MTPADKLRELRALPGVAKYYRLQAIPSRYGGAKALRMLVPGSDARPVTDAQALTYIESMQAREAVALGRELAAALGQSSWLDEPLPDGATHWAGKHGRRYAMTRVPDGTAVHFGEGCIGEQFNGPLGCYHSKETSMTTKELVVRTEGMLTPRPVEFTDAQLAVIKESIAKGASNAELELFVATCRRTGLDPFMRQIYAVKRYDSREKKEVMAIQVGIDGLRLIADRTDRYAGQDAVEFLDTDGVWSEVWTGVGFHPVAARAAVYRKDWPGRKAVAVCRWDSYAQYFGADHKLSPTWEKMPDVMLGKCAEALALRRAFPAEMSGLAAAVGDDYDAATDYEMQQAAVVRDDEAPSFIEGEVVYGDSQQASAAVPDASVSEDDAAPPAAPITLNDLIARIKAKLTDCQQTWGPSDYGNLVRALVSEYMPEGTTTFKFDALTLETAKGCLVELLRRRQEPDDPSLA